MSASTHRSGSADWTRPVIDVGSANCYGRGCPQEWDALQRYPTAGQKRTSRYQARPAPTHFLPRATFLKDGSLPPDSKSLSVCGNWTGGGSAVLSPFSSMAFRASARTTRQAICNVVKPSTVAT